MNYCGWLSAYFEAESEIRQGCPFFPLAFLLTGKMRAIKFRASIFEKSHMSLYTDKTTSFMKDEQDIQLRVLYCL